jgi:hypothetical protein
MRRDGMKKSSKRSGRMGEEVRKRQEEYGGMKKMLGKESLRKVLVGSQLFLSPVSAPLEKYIVVTRLSNV